MAEGVYVSPKGERLMVMAVQTQSHAGAYSLLIRAAAQMKSETQSQATKLKGIGIAGFALPNSILFYKGPVFVSITGKEQDSRVMRAA